MASEILHPEPDYAYSGFGLSSLGKKDPDIDYYKIYRVLNKCTEMFENREEGWEHSRTKHAVDAIRKHDFTDMRKFREVVGSYFMVNRVKPLERIIRDNRDARVAAIVKDTRFPTDHLKYTYFDPLPKPYEPKKEEWSLTFL